MPRHARAFVNPILALVFMIAGTAAGQEPAPQQTDAGDKSSHRLTSASFYMENDLFVKGAVDEDRNYTGGFGFQFSGDFAQHLEGPLNALDRLTRFSTSYKDSVDRGGPNTHTLLIFGTAFTPDDLRAVRPIPFDRPYASLIGASIRHVLVSPDFFDQAWSSELVVGVLGTPVARNVQTTIHRRLRARSGSKMPYDPKGWGTQISNGGEPTALYTVGYERHLIGAQPTLPGQARKHFEVTGGVGASAGYYTNVNALTNVRLGWFSSNFWEFTPSALNIARQNAGSAPSTWELFLFGSARPRLNFYNALLQGQFRESVYTVGIKHETLEWDLGVAAYIPFLRLQLTWDAYAGRTPEFTGSTRTHTWGSIIVGYSLRGKS